MTDEPLDPPIEEIIPGLIEQARKIARRHWHSAPQVLELEELVSLAYRGLVEASARWPEYCRKNEFDPGKTRYFAVYCLRRMNGSIMDYKRGQDWVSRTIRTRARSLREAGQDLGLSEAQMAEATGLSREQVAETLAAMAQRPVGFDPVEHDMRDAADTESHAVVDDLLAEAVETLRSLPLQAQFVCILTFYSGMPVRQAAAVLGIDPAQAQALQQEGVLAVHQALTRAARDLLWGSTGRSGAAPRRTRSPAGGTSTRT